MPAPYYIRNDAGVYGPFPLDQLARLRDTGQFQPVDEVSQDRNSWQPAATIPGLFAADDGAYRVDDYARDYRGLEPKHSGLGIASFIISLVAGIGIVGMVAAAVAMVVKNGGRDFDEPPPQAIMIGLGIFGCLFLDLIALGMGIGGLCQSNRKKIFAILGTLFSAATLMGVAGLIVIGQLAKQ